MWKYFAWDFYLMFEDLFRNTPVCDDANHKTQVWKSHWMKFKKNLLYSSSVFLETSLSSSTAEVCTHSMT